MEYMRWKQKEWKSDDMKAEQVESSEVKEDEMGWDVGFPGCGELMGWGC